MICLPGLIKAADLEKIAEFKLALREITLSKASLKTRIGLAASLKEALKITLEGQLKRAELARMEESGVTASTSKLTLLSCKTSGSVSETEEVSARLWMERHHRALMREVCFRFEERNSINITLYELQQHIDKTSCKYVSAVRQRDYLGQERAVERLRQANSQLRRILSSLTDMKETLGVQYEMILDNIKILRVRSSAINSPVTLWRSISSKRKSKGQQRHIPYFIQNNENMNQILVNL